MNGSPAQALRARGLHADLLSGGAVIEDVDVELRAGEILGLVGESGSGKTTTALSMFGYHERAVKIRFAEITISNEHLTDQKLLSKARGRLISYVPQNPGAALNPSMRIADGLRDIIEAHRGPADGSTTAAEMLERVGLPADREFGRRFPHQLSGGQQQRVCIAMALAAHPAVVVLDEPTTGLDVVTQDRILSELVRLRDEQGVAMLYITHDLAVVSTIANRIAVMYAGRIVEEGPADQILRRPRHPYTRGLVASTPDHRRSRALESMAGTAVGVGDRPEGCAFAARCPQVRSTCRTSLPELAEISPGHAVRCFESARTPLVAWAESLKPRDVPPAEVPPAEVLQVERLRAEFKSRCSDLVVARDVSFAVPRGGCVALVGESGSGKTTIARVIAGLHPLSAGRIRLGDVALPSLARHRVTEQRRRIQIVFQNPAEALNPRHTAGDAIARPARILLGQSRADSRQRTRELLDAVRLPAGIERRYPRELSGGERQRVALARALAAGPDVILCDEITSALDVSVQSVVLELLRDLRQDLGVALVFITHDLAVTATIAERVLVLRDGVICEQGPVSEVLGSPRDDYTRRLLDAAPSLSASIEAWERAGGPPALSD